jgi:hypothetical protein
LDGVEIRCRLADAILPKADITVWLAFFEIVIPLHSEGAGSKDEAAKAERSCETGDDSTKILETPEKCDWIEKFSNTDCGILHWIDQLTQLGIPEIRLFH